jgi:acyl carrier protein
LVPASAQSPGKIKAELAAQVRNIFARNHHAPLGEVKFGVVALFTTPLQRCRGGQFVAHVAALTGNPYDRHTLARGIPAITHRIGVSRRGASVDPGYRDHKGPNPPRTTTTLLSGLSQVCVASRRRSNSPSSAMVTEEERLATLTQILRDLLGDDTIELTMATEREDVPGWDSFAYINFIVATEAEYGVKFRIADVESFPNVGAIVTAIGTAKAR